MAHAAKVMAAVAADCLQDSALVAAAKADHAKRVAKTPYESPLPAECQPPIQPRPVKAA
jgi:aminobenzoyl-glutamate utilization protein B